MRHSKKGSRGFHGDKESEKPKSACYYLPADIRRALGLTGLKARPIIQKDVKNLSLLLNKFVPFSNEEGNVRSCNPGEIKASGNVLKALLGEVKVPKEAVGHYRRYFSSYRELLETIGAEKDTLSSTSRLVVGLGDESAYETSIRLLRNYSVPYIPGSALKGITRAWAIEMMAEMLKGTRAFSEDFYERAGQVQRLLAEGTFETFPERTEALFSTELRKFVDAVGVGESPREIAKMLVELFGTTKNEGRGIFLDALPEPPSGDGDWKLFEWDIMNPHYGPYYQNGEPPGDWHNPVPVFFLTVRKEMPFIFGVGGEMKDLARDLLRLALKYHGVGAKTSLGYGRFE